MSRPSNNAWGSLIKYIALDLDRIELLVHLDSYVDNREQVHAEGVLFALVVLSLLLL